MKRFLPYFLIVHLLCSCAMDFSEDLYSSIDDMPASALFADPAFAQYCFDTFDGSAGGTKDGCLQPEEITGVRTIDCSDLGITSLSGIEIFISLDTLICRGNRLVAIDLNSVPKLRYLDCSQNAIAELNVSHSDITALFCCPMTGTDGKNVLDYLYVRRGQEIPYITSNRNKAAPKRIPDETQIIAIPEAKDESF